MDTVLATQINSLFSSINYITPLIGAWLADTHWGRYKTILYFCIIYLIGMAGCTVSSYPGLFSGPGYAPSGPGAAQQTARPAALHPRVHRPCAALKHWFCRVPY